MFQIELIEKFQNSVEPWFILNCAFFCVKNVVPNILKFLFHIL